MTFWVTILVVRKDVFPVELRLLMRSALLLALIIIGGKLQIPLPYFDYYTLQFSFVLLAAVVLPLRYVLLTIGGYVFLGLLGLPVFAAGGGISYVLRPSFGYLIGFVVTGAVLACLAGKKTPQTVSKYYILNFIGLLITYAFGLGYKSLILTYYMNEVVPFWVIFTGAMAFDIPADLIMIFFLAILEVKVVPLLTFDRLELSRSTAK